MATITNRGPYQWRAKIRRAGYPEQSKTFETKADAEAWVRDIEGKMDRGIFIDRSALEKTKLFDILDRYEEEITPPKKGEAQEKSKLKILKKSKLSGMSLAVPCNSCRRNFLTSFVTVHQRPLNRFCNAFSPPLLFS